MHVIVQRRSGPILREMLGGKALKAVAEARIVGIEAWALRGRRLRDSIV